MCDEDDDNDLILDENDVCPMGDTGWVSRTLADFDGDGCRDENEDLDDDDDGICETELQTVAKYPQCQLIYVNLVDRFASNLQTDNDADG